MLDEGYVPIYKAGMGVDFYYNSKDFDSPGTGLGFGHNDFWSSSIDVEFEDISKEKYVYQVSYGNIHHESISNKNSASVICVPWE